MKTIVRTIVSVAYLALLACAFAVHAQQKLVPGQSEISFISKQMGSPVEGRFRKFDAQISFDPNKPEDSKIAFTIDLGSATLGDADTQAELAKPDWFDTKVFPQASFKSSSVKGTAAGKLEVKGKLTIKGSSHDVTVPVTLRQAGAATTASGAFVIKRLDFRIGDGDWQDTSMVANDVNVKFKLTMTGVDPL